MMGIADSQDEEFRMSQGRSVGEYTGADCKFCGRQRVMENGLGEIVCEKCNRDQVSGEYLQQDFV
jgi:ribosomal protein L37AE/L43A